MDKTIVGEVMRELTNAEIERFDFSGQIPDLHLPSHRPQQSAMAKTSQSNLGRSRSIFSKRSKAKQRKHLHTPVPA